MKRFIRNIILIFIPAFLLLAWYIIDDPFMMYWHYDNLCEYGQRKQCINVAYRGIRWMDQYDDSMHYNSFIIGSSRSHFYYVEYWKKYLSDDASCFHFGQSSDNLLGGLQRVKYLYKRFERIDNILIVMDEEYLRDMKPRTGLLYRQPWQVTEENDFFAFNRECILAFFSLEYQKRVWGLSKEENELHYYYIPEYNELHKDGAEELLESDPDKYYEIINKDSVFYERSGRVSIAEQVIHEEQKRALNELSALLKNHNTDYRIIISPLYNQISLNPVDVRYIQDVFGVDKVYDFSGINEYTNNVTNYYEDSHYRPKLCRQILKCIYQ